MNARDFLPLLALNTHSKMKMFSPKETRQQSYNMKCQQDLTGH